MTIVYFTAIAILGVTLAFRATPMSGIDEAYHFRRALQVSEGHLLASGLGANDWGGKLDRRLLAYEGWFNDRRNGARTSLVPDALAAETAMMRLPPGGDTASFPSTASYPPLPYLPAACGLLAGKLLHLGLSGQVLAGRLGSLAGWLGLLALVVRVLPVGRLGVLALLSMPAAIGVAASYSADPVTNGLACLFIAICVRLQLNAACRFGRGRKLGVLALAACLGLLKLTCALLSLATLLIPARYFRSVRQAWSFRLCGVALAFGTAATWNTSFPFIPGKYWTYGAQPDVAVQLILSAPAHHLWLVGWNIYHSSYHYWSDAFSRFGNGPLPLWMWFNGVTTQAALLLLLCLAASEARGNKRHRKAGLLLGALGCAYGVQTVLAFKIGFSRPDATIIQGVQGRYWILPYALVYLCTVMSVPGRRLAWTAAVPCLLLWLSVDVDFVLAALKGYAANWH